MVHTRGPPASTKSASGSNENSHFTRIKIRGAVIIGTIVRRGLYNHLNENGHAGTTSGHHDFHRKAFKNHMIVENTHHFAGQRNHRHTYHGRSHCFFARRVILTHVVHTCASHQGGLSYQFPRTYQEDVTPTRTAIGGNAQGPPGPSTQEYTVHKTCT